MLKELDGETKVAMACTGVYHLPIAYAFNEAELFVSTVNPIITHNYDNNSIRKSRNNKSVAIKIADCTITNWLKLSKYISEGYIRHILKAYSRQYNKYKKINVMLKNSLISLLDGTFPDANELFSSPPHKNHGHEKWGYFVFCFRHCKCISPLTQRAFIDRYRKWCKRAKYNFNESKAEDVYIESIGHFSVIPMNETTKLLITQAASQINAISETLETVSREMKTLDASLPEYSVVMEFRGAGDILGPPLIAEIGDIYRCFQKSSLVQFAGLEPVENQSGKFRGTETISKQGYPHFRKTLFQVMDCLLKQAPADDPISQFLDRKRTEGKHYYSCMTAGFAKFLRVYYTRVKEYLDKYISEE